MQKVLRREIKCMRVKITCEEWKRWEEYKMHVVEKCEGGGGGEIKDYGGKVTSAKEENKRCR